MAYETFLVLQVLGDLEAFSQIHTMLFAVAISLSEGKAVSLQGPKEAPGVTWQLFQLLPLFQAGRVPAPLRIVLRLSFLSSKAHSEGHSVSDPFFPLNSF